MGREILQCDGDLGGDNALDKAMRQLKVSSLIKEHGLLNSDIFDQADERQREAVANVIRAWDNASGKGYAEYPAVEDAVWEAPARTPPGVEPVAGVPFDEAQWQQGRQQIAERELPADDLPI